MLAAVTKPTIDWAGASPLIALLGGSVVILLAGLLRGRAIRENAVPFLTIVAFGAAIGLGIWQWHHTKDLFVAKGSQGTLRLDDLSLAVTFIVSAAGIATVLLSWRALAPREAAHGEYYSMLLTSAAGMVVLAAAQNLVTVFLGLELLSVPLYVLCATEMRRERSLESGLKYLIIGSVGSATLLYGLAFLYGASGDTDFRGIAAAISGGVAHDGLLLTGIGLTLVGLAFKASVAPFHQWTPDVYEGAPTPITTFMAVATKAAAFGVALRLLDVALIDAHGDWAPALATLATVTIIVGNVGALGQSSLKRLLAWSSVAQAGYLLAGVIVASQTGIKATVFYLMVYTIMNVAAFAVVIARERETGLGDDISAIAGIGATRPLLAWPLTLAMLSLAGMPATAGFIGKFTLIGAAADGGYTWLGIVIVVGSMISLAYYLRVVAAMWMRPAATGTEVVTTDGAAAPRLAGADPAAERGNWEVTAVAMVAGAGTLVFGIVPSPLLNVAADAGRALGLL
jgi:NADH-quinone oxidoreductase subunit N